MPDDVDEERTQNRQTDRWRPSRRRFLEAAGATGVVGGLGGLGLAQNQNGPVEIRLGGEVEGWTILGDFQADFLGEGPNPTLNLDAGQTYQVYWENLDGLPHNFALLNADGDYISQSEIIDEEGASQTVEFTAEEEMAQYNCQVHPTSMRGDINFAGGAETPETPGAEAAFFDEGARVGAQVVAEGMTAPTDFAQPETEDAARYVTDQTGEVWVVTEDGVQDEPFIDVSDRMVELGNFFGDYADQQQGYDERGLTGIVFHPDYQNNRRFYLHYSAPPDGVDQELPADNWDHWEILAEFQAGEDGTQGRLDSERRLLEIPSPQYNHDAGPFGFGPDGYLYFPMGDGGGANDNMYGHVGDWYERNGGGNGQDVTENLLGSVLRIDVDNEGEDRPYAIPEDNPLTDTEALPEIYAYGFRNPYGFSIDSEGNTFVADAGQNLFEEVNLVERGGNYGWNVKEGTHCFSTENPADPAAILDCPDSEPDEPPYDGSPLVDPIVEFPHEYQGEPVGITVVGGHRYEQSTVSELQGDYVYGVWTTDVARQAPQGRVLAATPPEGFGADGGTETGAATETGTETEADTQTGTETGTQTGTDDGEADPGAVPREELWEMSELVFAGTEDGQLPYFVRMFGRDADGAVYVLVSQRGIPEGDTGAVLQIVPPDEGDELVPAQTETATEETPVEDPGEEPGDTPENATAGNATGGNATAENETAGNATAGNATTGNATTGNATGGNETDGTEST